MQNKINPLDPKRSFLVQMKDRMIELFFEYMRIIGIFILLTFALGMLVKVCNNLLDLETAVLKLQLEACRIEQDLSMVDEATEKIDHRIGDAQRETGELKRRRTFDRQMRALDRIDKSIGDTAVKLEELKDGS